MPVLLISLTCSICSFSNAQYMISNISVGNDGLFLITAHSLSNEDFKGEPSYLLEVQTSSNRVNAGENFSMRIFLSGAGDVVFGKIRVNIPTYIVKDKYVTLKDISFNFYRGSEPGQVAYNATTNTTNQEPQIDLNIPNIHFTPRDIKAFVNFGETAMKEGEIPPYTINFTISPNAPQGDQDIYVKLFYKYGNKWYADTQIVPLHINNWYEQEWLQWLVLISVFVSLILQIIQTIRK